jgi:uncharacterized protein YbcI
MTDRRQAEVDEHVGYSIAARISTRMVKLMSEYTGRGPTKARTTLNTNFVLVVLEDTLTKGERKLVEAGEVEAVRRQRRTFHELMRAEATAAVEEITGRKVRAQLTDMSPEDGVAVEVFLLESRPETGHVYVSDSNDGDGRGDR